MKFLQVALYSFLCGIYLSPCSPCHDESRRVYQSHTRCFPLVWRKRFKGTATPDAAATVPTPADGGGATAATVVTEHTEGGDEILTVTAPSTAGGGGGGGTRAVFNMTEGCLSRLQLLGSSNSDGGGDGGAGALDVDLLETIENQGQGAYAREDHDQVRGCCEH